MRTRRFGRTGWDVSELGVGMWGIAGWADTDETEAHAALELTVGRGCTFYDTAWGYGEGRSECILGDIVEAHPRTRLYTATKVPPKNRIWPSRRGFLADDAFPYEYVLEYAEISRRNLDVDTIDLLQFHVWEDDWADEPGWRRAIEELKASGRILAAGVSINRWEPWNAIRTLQTGQIDAVQVIYNIFDQAPEDELFPVCRELDIGVIARVPFDEGSLAGTLTVDSRWPDGDWRNTYFVPENLASTVEHVERLRPTVPDGMTMAQMALRFTLSNPDVHTVIPGMRRIRHVEENVAAANAGPLPADLLASLREHRWDRVPTAWSQ